jgi:sterol 3beta-glucosyltransferase
VRVAVPAMGSHGDVEPFLALAAGLRRRGHTVVVATHAEFAALVTGAGVEFAEFFWGGRVAAPAAGAPPIPRERLTGARLAAALTDALRRRHGARRIAQALPAEDGVAAAVDLLEARL